MKIAYIEDFRHSYADLCFFGYTSDVMINFKNVILPLAGLNVFKLNPFHLWNFKSPQDRELYPNQIKAGFKQLKSMLKRKQFDYIIAAGKGINIALESPEPLIMQSGIPYISKHLPDSLILPTFPGNKWQFSDKILLQVFKDYTNFGEYIKFNIRKPTIPGEIDNSIEISKVEDLKDYLNKGFDHIAIDTEFDENKVPFSLQFSINGIKGVFIHADSTKVLTELNHQLHKNNPKLIIHHSLVDLPMMEKLGIDYNKNIKDTMLMAAYQGNIPKGLKALAYRLLNIKMLNYNEVVRTVQNKLAIEYLNKLSEIEFPNLPEQMIYKKIDKNDIWEHLAPYRPQNLNTRINKLIWKYSGYPGEYIEKDIYEIQKKIIRKKLNIRSVQKKRFPQLWKLVSDEDTLKEFDEQKQTILEKYSGDLEIDLAYKWKIMDNKDQAIEALGEMPIASLKHVDRKLAVKYSGTDAIVTYKIYFFLKQLLNNYYRGFKNC